MEEVVRSAEAKIYNIQQKQALGVGNTVWCACHFIGNEPFAILLGDSIEQCIGQLMEDFDKIGMSIVDVHRVLDRKLEDTESSIRAKGKTV